MYNWLDKNGLPRFNIGEKVEIIYGIGENSKEEFIVKYYGKNYKYITLETLDGNNGIVIDSDSNIRIRSLEE